MEFINVKKFQDAENKRAFEKIRAAFMKHFVRKKIDKKINNVIKNALRRMSIVPKTLTAAIAADVNNI